MTHILQAPLYLCIKWETTIKSCCCASWQGTKIETNTFSLKQEQKAAELEVQTLENELTTVRANVQLISDSRLEVLPRDSLLDVDSVLQTTEYIQHLFVVLCLHCCYTCCRLELVQRGACLASLVLSQVPDATNQTILRSKHHSSSALFQACSRAAPNKRVVLKPGFGGEGLNRLQTSKVLTPQKW